MLCCVLGGAGCTFAPDLNGQSATGVTQEQIQLLYRSAQCDKISHGGFLLIDDPRTLEIFLQPLGEAEGLRISGQIDFNTQQVLVVDFGASASGGVTEGAVSTIIEQSAGTATIRIQPPRLAQPHKRQTQNVTHSCALYVMPSDYESVEIRGQYNDLLMVF